MEFTQFLIEKTVLEILEASFLHVKCESTILHMYLSFNLTVKILVIWKSVHYNFPNWVQISQGGGDTQLSPNLGLKIT